MKINLSWFLLQWKELSLIAAVGICILSGAIATEQLDSLRAAVAHEKSQLTRLRELTDLPESFGEKRDQSAAEQHLPLLVKVEKALGAAPWKAYVGTLRQLSAQRVQLSFSRINWDDLIVGLVSLSEKENINAEKISVRRYGLSDFAAVELVLA